jgi:hypothetical protein
MLQISIIQGNTYPAALVFGPFQKPYNMQVGWTPGKVRAVMPSNGTISISIHIHNGCCMMAGSITHRNETFEGLGFPEAR